MTTTANVARDAETTLVARLTAGVGGGLVGGVMFGALMQMMDMMPMVAQLVHSDAVAVGWLVHLVNSVLFGAAFALLFSRWLSGWAAAIIIGMGYGVALWVFGALLVMPARLGMTNMIFHVGTAQWQSLMGHVLYGMLLGVGYTVLRHRPGRA